MATHEIAMHPLEVREVEGAGIRDGDRHEVDVAHVRVEPARHDRSVDVEPDEMVAQGDPQAHRPGPERQAFAIAGDPRGHLPTGYAALGEHGTLTGGHPEPTVSTQCPYKRPTQ